MAGTAILFPQELRFCGDSELTRALCVAIRSLYAAETDPWLTLSLYGRPGHRLLPRADHVRRQLLSGLPTRLRHPGQQRIWGPARHPCAGPRAHRGGLQAHLGRRRTCIAPHPPKRSRARNCTIPCVSGPRRNPPPASRYRTCRKCVVSGPRTGGGGVSYFVSRSSRRRILPVTVFGSSSTIST